MARKISDEYIECNLEKYECGECRNQFIVGTEMLNGREPICPYCGEKIVEKTVWTEDENLECMDLGCLSLIKEIGC